MRMKTVRITAEIVPAQEGGFVVYCPELDITTEGETTEEALAMLKDAAEGYIEVVGITNIPHFPPSTKRQTLELTLSA